MRVAAIDLVCDAPLIVPVIFRARPECFHGKLEGSHTVYGYDDWLPLTLIFLLF